MMFTLNEHIEYLMMHHDCVVVPGWGALVAQYSESFYDADAQQVKRPSRKLGFNSQVNHNDGMLAQSIVRREGLSYDQAVRFIDRNVTIFKQQLQAGDEVSMGRLGFFKSDRNNHVEFIPFYHEMCNDQYFGLRSVTFKPLSQLDRDDNGPKAVVAEPGWWTSRRVWQTAASIAVLLALSVALTTPIVVNRNNHELASLNVAELKSPKHEAVSPQSQVKTQPRPKQQTVQESKESSPLMLDEGGNYYLVIASLGSTRQVNEYLALHPDVAPHTILLDRGRYIHVCVARSGEAQRLYSFMNSLPKGYQAWVYENK